MSIDRCSRCGDLVDTDAEPEAYVEVGGDPTAPPDYICLCREHREQHEEAMPEWANNGWHDGSQPQHRERFIP